jgi:hypothetical protein
MGTLSEVATKEMSEERANVVKREGGFWRRRPSVDLRLTYPDVKMQGIVKNTVIKLKGVAYKECDAFERRTCANPITLTGKEMNALQDKVDERLSEIAKEEELTSSQLGYINGHMTNHFNDYITVE